MIFQLLWKKWKIELAEPCTDRTEQRTQSAGNNKNEVVFGKNADPKITETAKAKTPVGPSNSRKVIETIPISRQMHLSIC